jgi:hypothetical protein
MKSLCLSAGVVSRDVSEKIEEQIVLHCKSFSRGIGFSDLARHGQQWDVRILQREWANNQPEPARLERPCRAPSAFSIVDSIPRIVSTAIAGRSR